MRMKVVIRTANKVKAIVSQQLHIDKIVGSRMGMAFGSGYAGFQVKHEQQQSFEKEGSSMLVMGS